MAAPDSVCPSRWTARAGGDRARARAAPRVRGRVRRRGARFRRVSKSAGKSGARFLVIMGEDEWQRGEVALKRFESGTQGSAGARGAGRSTARRRAPRERSRDAHPRCTRRLAAFAHLRRADEGRRRQQRDLMGWCTARDDHGGVPFIDLRDRYGLTQVCSHPETGGPNCSTARRTVRQRVRDRGARRGQPAPGGRAEPEHGDGRDRSGRREPCAFFRAASRCRSR